MLQRCFSTLRAGNGDDFSWPEADILSRERAR